MAALSIYLLGARKGRLRGGTLEGTTSEHDEHESRITKRAEQSLDVSTGGIVVTNMSQTQLLFTIDPGFKTIPYLPAERPEGSTCHGFKSLKGRPAAEAEAIPEASDTACIQRALVTINHPRTSVFTVGCEKAFNEDEQGYWVKGYIEFAFNYVDISRDAVPYFIAFFQFNEFLKRQSYDDPIQFHWELQGCAFLDADRQTGFATTVWVTTAFAPSADVVRDAWCRAIDLLTEFLSSFEMRGAEAIYG